MSRQLRQYCISSNLFRRNNPRIAVEFTIIQRTGEEVDENRAGPRQGILERRKRERRVTRHSVMTGVAMMATV